MLLSTPLARPPLKESKLQLHRPSVVNRTFKSGRLRDAALAGTKPTKPATPDTCQNTPALQRHHCCQRHEGLRRSGRSLGSACAAALTKSLLDANGAGQRGALAPRHYAASLAAFANQHRFTDYHRLYLI